MRYNEEIASLGVLAHRLHPCIVIFPMRIETLEFREPAGLKEGEACIKKMYEACKFKNLEQRFAILQEGAKDPHAVVRLRARQLLRTLTEGGGAGI